MSCLSLLLLLLQLLRHRHHQHHTAAGGHQATLAVALCVVGALALFSSSFSSPLFDVSLCHTALYQ
jgi:hypothetical protein